MMAELNAHQERMITGQEQMLVKLDVCLEKTEAWLGDLKATVLEANQEEVKVTVEQQEVFHEEIKVETIGAM
jgi:hypothetical protein